MDPRYVPGRNCFHRGRCQLDQSVGHRCVGASRSCRVGEHNEMRSHLAVGTGFPPGVPRTTVKNSWMPLADRLRVGIFRLGDFFHGVNS